MIRPIYLHYDQKDEATVMKLVERVFSRRVIDGIYIAPPLNPEKFPSLFEVEEAVNGRTDGNA